MNRIDNSGKGIAGLGRGEDSMLAHVAPGEMVVPPVISPQTQEIIKREMMSAGLDPNEYTVGQGMSINPITGMAEFGFLKKLGKSLKKVVKKVAPVAMFIPGVGTALGGALGGLGGLATKGLTKIGLGSVASGPIEGPPIRISSSLAITDLPIANLGRSSCKPPIATFFLTPKSKPVNVGAGIRSGLTDCLISLSPPSLRE